MSGKAFESLTDILVISICAPKNMNIGSQNIPDSSEKNISPTVNFPIHLQADIFIRNQMSPIMTYPYVRICSIIFQV